VPGHLESIFIAPAAKAPLVGVPEVRAVVGRGLEGDRYFLGQGSFSRWPGDGRPITLIEAEAIDTVLQETGIDLSAGRSRRNLVTRDVRLADLNGRRFRIGEALLRGTRLCAPCAFLERLTEPGVFAALKGRGGLRAEILEGGTIRAGDTVRMEV
jgi:MOSC domain-containing protein YiiM